MKDCHKWGFKSLMTFVRFASDLFKRTQNSSNEKFRLTNWITSDMAQKNSIEILHQSEGNNHLHLFLAILLSFVAFQR